MTLTEMILLRAGFHPRQLGIAAPIKTGRRERLSLSAVIDIKAGRNYSSETLLWRLRLQNQRRKHA